jgi:hypothetical protein
MALTSVQYAELETLSSVGFVSKREARNTHYRQAKVCTLSERAGAPKQSVRVDAFSAPV